MATCEVCGNEEARYVCSSCGRKVGNSCLMREGWFCTICAKLQSKTVPVAEPPRTVLPSTLLIIAFGMILVGFILLAISSSSTGQGGFVIIFPFFFASSNGSAALLIPAIIVVLIMLILGYFSLRRMGKAAQN